MWGGAITAVWGTVTCSGLTPPLTPSHRQVENRDLAWGRTSAQPRVPNAETRPQALGLLGRLLVS